MKRLLRTFFILGLVIAGLITILKIPHTPEVTSTPDDVPPLPDTGTTVPVSASIEAVTETLSPIETPTPTVTPYITVLQGYHYCRDQPTRSSREVALLRGQQITFIAKEGDWMYVYIQDYPNPCWVSIQGISLDNIDLIPTYAGTFASPTYTLPSDYVTDDTGSGGGNTNPPVATWTPSNTPEPKPPICLDLDKPKLSGSRNGSNVSLSWNPVPGATSYKVYRSVNDGNYTSIGNTNVD